MKLRNKFFFRRVKGGSMLPALKEGQIILGINCIKYNPGDIVMLSHRGIEKVKRVKKIVEGMVYLIGDNPSSSLDSRDFGYVDRSCIYARVIWPRN